MNYKDAWTFLDNLQFFKIKLGLDSMSMFLSELGNPQDSLQYIHVAGTNGKGSVSAHLLSILSRAGYRVGLYTSPHLTSVRERFRINDDFISEAQFAVHASEIQGILGGRQITYFEFTTALALLWFAAEKVDFVLLEVGLGGRLDATNVITPLVSVITNVSMDHEAYLGNTLAEVASEKAGIIKPGVPVVSAVGYDGEPVPLSVVQKQCRNIGAPLFLLDTDFVAEPEEYDTWAYWGMRRKGGCCKLREKMVNLKSGLVGHHQRANGALALAVIELLQNRDFVISEEAIREGLSKTRWPGRLEFFHYDPSKGCEIEDASSDSVRILLDGAHNPAGGSSLRAALEDFFNYKKLYLIWGAMADKDIAATLSFVAPLAHTIYLAWPDAGDRSASPEQLLAVLSEEDQKKAVLTESVAAAVKKAMEMAATEDLICIAGSLYLIGEARGMLLGELIADGAGEK